MIRNVTFRNEIPIGRATILSRNTDSRNVIVNLILCQHVKKTKINLD